MSVVLLRPYLYCLVSGQAFTTYTNSQPKIDRADPSISGPAFFEPLQEREDPPL